MSQTEGCLLNIALRMQKYQYFKPNRLIFENYISGNIGLKIDILWCYNEVCISVLFLKQPGS